MFPTVSGLSVSKTTGNDASLVIGLYSPFKYGKKTYEGYNLERLKNYCRFMLICEDRDYGANQNICPLFFNGASSYWAELPRPDDSVGMNAVYSYIETLEKKKVEKTFFSRIRNLLKIN